MLPDEKGAPHLVTAYMKTKGSLRAYEWGLLAWDDKTSKLETLRVLWNQSEQTPEPPPRPEGHEFSLEGRWRKTMGAVWRSLSRLALPRDVRGVDQPRHVGSAQTAKSRCPVGGGDEITPHRGSDRVESISRAVRFNLHAIARQTVAAWRDLVRRGGLAARPLGTGRESARHEHYTFYNPMIHAEMTPAGSPALFFAGTYSMDFSDARQRTPRYDYNQVLYRLDLDELVK